MSSWKQLLPFNLKCLCRRAHSSALLWLCHDITPYLEYVKFIALTKYLQEIVYVGQSRDCPIKGFQRFSVVVLYSIYLLSTFLLFSNSFFLHNHTLFMKAFFVLASLLTIQQRPQSTHWYLNNNKKQPTHWYFNKEPNQHICIENILHCQQTSSSARSTSSCLSLSATTSPTIRLLDRTWLGTPNAPSSKKLPSFQAILCNLIGEIQSTCVFFSPFSNLLITCDCYFFIVHWK